MVCIRCGLDRPGERFEARRRVCRECNNAAARAKGRRTYTPAGQRWSEYRLTRHTYDAMFEAQGGRCLVCHQIPRKTVVDHDHRTGDLRGLLCGPCNRALGHLQDRPGLCLAAARYLRGLTNS